MAAGEWHPYKKHKKHRIESVNHPVMGKGGQTRTLTGSPIFSCRLSSTPSVMSGKGARAALCYESGLAKGYRFKSRRHAFVNSFRACPRRRLAFRPLQLAGPQGRGRVFRIEKVSQNGSCSEFLRKLLEAEGVALMVPDKKEEGQQ